MDSHLTSTLTCPVCSAEYQKTAQDEFQEHVEVSQFFGELREISLGK